MGEVTDSLSLNEPSFTVCEGGIRSNSLCDVTTSSILYGCMCRTRDRKRRTPPLGRSSEWMVGGWVGRSATQSTFIAGGEG